MLITNNESVQNAGPARAGSGPSEYFFFWLPTPQQERNDKGKSTETKQTASYARWRLAASADKTQQITT
jgi:hypothetical protein